jgi:hypothetical protein
MPVTQLLLEIVEILNTIKQTISADTDIVWTRFDSVGELVDTLNKYIKRVEESDSKVFHDLKYEFAPTGSLQELSISNGWGEEFLHIADRYDEIYSQLTSAR